MGKTIATIYFFVISAASLALIVIGVFNIVNFLINSTQYEKYPLRYGGISNCDYAVDGIIYSRPIPAEKSLVPPPGGDATPSAAEVERAKQQCLANEDEERRKHRVDNIRDAITFTLVGLILFAIHFPQAKKRSN